MQYEKNKETIKYDENDEKMIKSETNHKRNNDDTIKFMSKDMKKWWQLKTKATVEWNVITYVEKQEQDDGHWQERWWHVLFLQKKHLKTMAQW